MHATKSIRNTFSNGFKRGRAGAVPSRRSRQASGFSLTELLVVIAIIVLLVGLLLVALKHVRGKALRTQTESLMNAFASSCAAFQVENGYYPEMIPDDVLAKAGLAPNAEIISSTENALLAMMGGARVLSPNDTNPASPAVIEYNNFGTAPTAVVHEFTFAVGAGGGWKLKVDKTQIGQGPLINGKPRASYFTPGPNDLRPVEGQVNEANGFPLPDLVDAWGQPILFVKKARDTGPLVADVNMTNALPQFTWAGTQNYLNSTGLGEMGKPQGTKTILGIGAASQKNNIAAVVLEHPSSYKAPNVGDPGAPLRGTARGAFMLLSAGPDGVFFAINDGPGSEATPLNAQGVNNQIVNVGPRVLDQFDDIRVFGGG